MSALGTVLHRIREARKISQDDLADEASRILREIGQEQGLEIKDLGLSGAAICRIETGKTKSPTTLTLVALATVLRFSLDEICQEAGLLPHRDDIDSLSPTEQQLIENLRSISRPEERQEILDHVLGLVRFAADVDSIVQERLREASEASEEPGEQPTED